MDADYLKAAFKSGCFALSLVRAIIRILEEWFRLNLPIPHWALISLAVLGFTMALYKAYEKLHKQRAIEVGEKSEEKERLKETLTELSEERRTGEGHQLEFDFRLYSKPGPHIFMQMASAYVGDYNISVPFIGVSVSNEFKRHIEVVACHLAKTDQSNQTTVQTGQIIEPMRSGDVDVTRRLIELVAESCTPNWDRIFGSYGVEVAVEWRSEKGERPVKSDVKMFDLEISRTGGLALGITVSPHRRSSDILFPEGTF